MSLASLSDAYQDMSYRVESAEQQFRHIQDLLVLWFVESDEGARQWLREIAKDHKRLNPKPEASWL